MPIHKGMLETWNMYMSEGKKSREKDAVQKIYRRGMRWSGLCNPQGGNVVPRRVYSSITEYGVRNIYTLDSCIALTIDFT